MIEKMLCRLEWAHWNLCKFEFKFDENKTKRKNQSGKSYSYFILWGKSGMYHHIWIQNYFGLIVSDLAYIHISGVFHVSWVISAIPLCYVGCASFCSKGEVMLKQFRVRNNMVRYFTHAMKQFNLYSFLSVVCVIAKD